ncbi:TAT-variant-translocated molybdopterin oxidoreductase [Riemerella columbipharyngis]|uniref:Prokaryotic molybdopterin-containing oxidoreductase family, iron-sulfur binding subunit n=1 Tax=Riemerella columbipharyngis TaxID=1071918 RepID=A0A1G7EDN3_9FLAO|nr:TAT-variant-translocated molybdopterin oxidoreductase [Riemerella columbipharyngis]SDE61778.1 prokaryotic molybdopterin-containing oxidoreductase family, iron-sulfur binding subunit [Riemerella columbipharyngis]
MASKKIQFRSIHELKDPSLNTKLAQKEFQNEIPVDEFLGNEDKMNNSGTSRRDFLKFLGFSTVAVTLAACESPVIKTIPYVTKPHNIIPGVPNFYATSYFDGFDFASVLVKTREGRPIKIDSNSAAEQLGCANARVQAGLLSLYDNDKLRQPALKGENATFDKVDSYVLNGLAQAQAVNKKIVVLSHSYPSPTFKKIFADFQAKYPNAELVTYDAVPYASALDASEEVFGQRALPVYDLSNSELVIGFQANFIESYSGGSLEKSYGKARKPGPNMLRHIQVESNLSLTGANADTRIRLKPSEVNKLLVEVYNGLNGGTSDAVASKLVAELKAKGSKAVVIAEGSKGAYVLTHLINQKLKSNAFTGKANFLREFDANKYSQFLSWLNQGQVGAVIINNVNPIYSHEDGAKFEALLKKVPCKVALINKRDEVFKASDAVIPVSHCLESWGDFIPESGVYTLMQPTIQKIFKSRQIEEALLVWTNGKNNSANDLYAYLKNNATSILGDSTTFNKALYDGYNVIPQSGALSYNGGDAQAAIADLKKFQSSDLELMLYTKTSMGDGTQADNPWLQEMPDPISRLSWDNYLTVSPKDADKLGLDNSLNGRMQLDGSVVDLTVNGKTIKNVPVFIQPGQADGSLGLALGYGKKLCGKVADVGVNAYPAYNGSDFAVSGVKLSKTSESDHEFAGMQLQNTLMGRYDIAKEVTLEKFLNVPFDSTKRDAEGNIEGWNVPLEYETLNGEQPAHKVDLWDVFDDTDGPHFNLSIDLNACTGCGACVIACQVENNTPVVGKDEIRMSRDMYWLRIDRYYSAKEKLEQVESLNGREGRLDVPEMYGNAFNKDSGILNHPAENPDVIFQPVMCQQCNHAPCETVCPVAATSHGKQGQNMMAYNRCIGTRYCANNCPYKVRRFNWFNYSLNDKFDYNMNNDLGRMVLNPDVVVRTRGVMEKCSFCIQSTQAAILTAKKDNRRVTDEEFNDACACSKACSTGAMRFGDINDKSSEVRELYQDERRYHLLEEIGTKPNIFYHVKVRNRKEEENKI